MNNLIHKAALVMAAMTMGACASWSPPPASSPQKSSTYLEHQLASRHPDLQLRVAQRDAVVEQLLHQPLTPQTATQLMLLNAPRIEMLLAELGIANARRAQVELIANPHFAVGALRSEGGGRWQLDLGLSQSLLDLLTRSLRIDLADAELAQQQLALQGRLDEAIHELQSAYFAAVAAQEHLTVAEQYQLANDAAYALAQAMRTAGNLSPASFLQHQGSMQQISQEIRQARLAADTSRLQLAYLLGLQPHQTFELPKQLPNIPEEHFLATDLLLQAQQHRPELALIRRQQDFLADQHPIITRSRWADITAGINVEREFDGAINAGPEVEFGLPLFDRGQAKLARLTAQSDAARAQEAHLLRKTEYEIALALRQLDDARQAHQDAMALQKTAREQLNESQREVNFMLASPFDLLALKQQQIRLAADRIEAAKHYWQARTALVLAVGKTLPIAEPTGDTAPARPSTAHPDHHGDHHHD